MNEDYETLQATKEEENEDDSTDSSSYSFPSYTRFTFTGKTKSRLGRRRITKNETDVKQENSSACSATTESNAFNRGLTAQAPKSSHVNWLPGESTHPVTNSFNVKEDNSNACPTTNESNAFNRGFPFQAQKTPKAKWMQGNSTHPVTNPFTPAAKETNYVGENDSGIDISNQSNFLSFLKNDSTCKRNLGFNNTPYKIPENQPTSLRELNKLFQKNSAPSINFVYKPKGKENHVSTIEDPWNKLKRICDSTASQPPKPSVHEIVPKVEKSIESKNISKLSSVPSLHSSAGSTVYKNNAECESPNVPLDLSTNENLSGNRSIYGRNLSGDNDSATSSTASASTILLPEVDKVAQDIKKLSTSDHTKETPSTDTFNSLLPAFLVATNKTNLNETPQVVSNNSTPFSSSHIVQPQLKSYSPPDSQNIIHKSVAKHLSTVQPTPLGSAGTEFAERKVNNKHSHQSSFPQISRTLESKPHPVYSDNITAGSQLKENPISVKTNQHSLGVSGIKTSTERYQHATSSESNAFIKPQLKLCEPVPNVLHNNHLKPQLPSLNPSSCSAFKSESSSFQSTVKHVTEKQNTLSDANLGEKQINGPCVPQNNQHRSPPSTVQPSLKTSPETQDKFTDDFNQAVLSNGCNKQKTYLAPAQPVSEIKPEVPAVFSRPVESAPAKRPQNCFKAPAPRGLMSRANTDLYVNNKVYTILSMLGRGGSSEVFQVIDPRSTKLLAVKCVDLSMVDKMIADGYLNEIDVLSKLQGCASVIRMFDYEYVQEQKMLYVVMEKGDTDLSHLIRDISMTKKISMSMIIYYWTEMLNAVKDIHDQGIIHSDLKPANFLLVSGRLKLIDFGIASSQGDMTSVVKEVTTGTWNYMSPEALRNTSATGKGFKITYKSDVWSLGCILYNLVYGKTPFAHITNTWGKLQAIADPNHQIEFPEVGAPPVLMQALKSCLQREPTQRPTVGELLALPYHSTSNLLAVQIHSILPSEYWLQVKHLFPEINSTQDRRDPDSKKQ